MGDAHLPTADPDDHLTIQALRVLNFWIIVVCSILIVATVVIGYKAVASL